MEHPPPSERATVQRLPKRGTYDRTTIDAILDEGLVCHVAFLMEGQPCVIPTLYVRLDDHVYMHGSAASRMLRALVQGSPVCIAVTLIDGLVLARSNFHHSMNYRSVVLYGTASEVAEPARKVEVLRRFSEHVIPGRWNDVRGPDEQELRATLVVSVPIEEASAKIRTGPPKDDEPDYALPIWAGIVPLRMVAGTPIPDPALTHELEPPAYASAYPGPKRG